jgi:Tfp pilus assembly protein PilN
MRAVNLLPADQRGGASRSASRSGGGAYAVLVLIGGLALLAVLYGTARHHVSGSKAKLAALEVKVQRAQAETSSLAPYTSFVALREQRVQAVSQLVNSRFDWAHAVHELGRVLPSGVSISSFGGTVGTAKGSTASASSAASAGVSSSTPSGSVPTVTLSGCAKSQSTVAVTLDRLRLMDGVSAVSLQSSTKSGGSGGGGGTGGCPGSDPAFNVQVNFDALPTQSAPISAVAPAALSSKGGSTNPTAPKGATR